MKTIYYLVEVNPLGTFNIYSGTEEECEAQLKKEEESPFRQRTSSFYVSMNRFD